MEVGRLTNLDIDAFLMICQHKSISRAAESLFICQSTLSERLKSLERELNCTLFLRRKGSRDLVLTAEGEVFYDLALQYRNIVKKMLALGTDHSNVKLCISSINSIANYLLPPVYEQFARQYPHIQLELQDMQAEQACRSILQEKTDLAFSTENRITERITATPFLAEPLVFVCTADSSYPDTVDTSMLSIKNQIYAPWSSDLERWQQMIFGTSTLPQVQLGLVNQIQFFLTKPADWAIVPHGLAKQLLKDNRIRQCQTTFEIPHRMIYILSDRRAHERECVVCFLECLKEVLSNEDTTGLLL